MPDATAQRVHDDLTEFLSDIETLAIGNGFSMGQKARIADRLASLAKALNDEAKAEAIERAETGGPATVIDDDVVFEYVKASEFQAVDTSAVKRRYPVALNPDLYKTQSRAASVRIKVAAK